MDKDTTLVTMEKITSLAKRRGFIFQGSEIYGGYQGFWDYGPLGVELKNNVKKEWWKTMVYKREDVVGIDAAIIMNPTVWEKSGHLKAFTDPLVECKNCNKRYRVDSLVSDSDLNDIRERAVVYGNKINSEVKKEIDEQLNINKTIKLINSTDIYSVDQKKNLSEQLQIVFNNKNLSADNKLKIVDKILIDLSNTLNFIGPLVLIHLNERVQCPNCKEYGFWSEPKTFNLMTEVLLGTTEPKEMSYLRGEITQGVFVNFKNVVDSTRIKIPFGIAQIGKAFRNEITPGNLTFRSREFEQMELEYFVRPDEKTSEETFNEFKEIRINWYKDLGLNPDKLHFHDHEPEKRAHYAKYATDIEYKTPFGWSEMEGIHHRGDYDLKNHGLTYRDDMTNEEFTPWVIETSGGVDRATLFFLIDAYKEEGDRVILKLSPKLAPYKVAIFPLLKNKPELVEKARNVYKGLKENFNVIWDDRGNIGKRYFAQDEIGTPWCVTVDFQSLDDGTVTVRDRDSATQERISIDKLTEYFQNELT